MLTLDVFFPQNHQRDVLAFQLAMNACPVWLGMTATALFRLAIAEQFCLKRLIGHVFRQRPDQAGDREPLKRRPHGRWCNAKTTGDLAGQYATNKLQPKNFAHLAHGRPLCWH